MSTAPSPPPRPPLHTEPTSITIISHSNLFYWWPVWAVGFLMAILTAFSGYSLAVVPNQSDASRTWRVLDPETGSEQAREGVLVRLKPNGQPYDHLPPNTAVNGKLVEPEQPHLQISSTSNYGVIFVTVLLLVIFITNVPLRGMWSVVVIMTIVLMTVIFQLAGMWQIIIEYVRLLDIRINTGGYMVIATGVFILWAVTFFLFDRQIYMVFTPGQLKVCTEIGGGEKVYDTIGMTLEKHRSDLFRHWILGLGSGDLEVKTSGAQMVHFDLHNVLFIGTKVKQIEYMLKTQKTMEVK